MNGVNSVSVNPILFNGIQEDIPRGSGKDTWKIVQQNPSYTSETELCSTSKKRIQRFFRNLESGFGIATYKEINKFGINTKFWNHLICTSHNCFKIWETKKKFLNSSFNFSLFAFRFCFPFFEIFPGTQIEVTVRWIHWDQSLKTDSRRYFLDKVKPSEMYCTCIVPRLTPLRNILNVKSRWILGFQGKYRIEKLFIFENIQSNNFKNIVKTMKNV